MRALGEILRDMTERADIPYLTPELERIRMHAESLGGGSKPSGAGGGDCAIALLPDPDSEREFLSRIRKDGLISIPIRPSIGAYRTPTLSPG